MIHDVSTDKNKNCEYSGEEIHRREGIFFSSINHKSEGKQNIGKNGTGYFQLKKMKNDDMRRYTHTHTYLPKVV